MVNSVNKTVTLISIHAPARGATLFNLGFVKHSKHFNPRTREGCDVKQVYFYLLLQAFQSTHPRGVRLEPLQIPL